MKCSNEQVSAGSKKDEENEVLPHKVKLALKVLIHKTLGPAVKIVSDEQFNELLFRLMLRRLLNYLHYDVFLVNS